MPGLMQLAETLGVAAGTVGLLLAVRYLLVARKLVTIGAAAMVLLAVAAVAGIIDVHPGRIVELALMLVDAVRGLF